MTKSPITVLDRVRALRTNRGETCEQFGALIGLSKGKVSELEAGKYLPSVRVAVIIEQISGGAIDAAELCKDVRLARHGAEDSPSAPAPSPDKAGENIGGCDRGGQAVAA